MHSSRRTKKIFISHSAQDRTFVLRLMRVLERHRVRYWYSAEQIRGAQEWHDEIGRALTECDWFLVVLTSAAVRSLWVKRELFFALNEKRYHRRIIPLLRKPCQYGELSWTLRQFEFVDFTGDFEVACQRLLQIWGIDYQPESAAARVPNKKRKKAH